MDDPNRLSEKAKSRGNSLVLLSLFISVIVWILIGDFIDNYFGGFGIAFFLFLGLFFISSKIQYALSSEEDKKIIDENSQKIEEFKQKKKNNPTFENIIYVSGIAGMNNQVTGTLAIEKDCLCLYDLMGFNKLYELKINQIQNIVYDLSSNITVGRALLFGLGALVLKKNTYYLIIEYVSDKGINNQLVFNTQSNKNMFFYNSLNTARNTYWKPIESGKTNSIAEQIRELAKLRDEGILTEEEFSDKKRALLEKIS